MVGVLSLGFGEPHTERQQSLSKLLAPADEDVPAVDF